ncbi:MAG: DNA-directed RNA polymerase subunit P [Candidatus Woesearchaeota archaeon]
MAYVCFKCKKEVDENYLKRKVQCPYCGSRIFVKSRVHPTKIKVE